MTQKADQKHQFAFYVPEVTQVISGISVGQELTISDPDLLHRLFRVVRIASGDVVILFDQKNHVFFQIKSTDKKEKIFGSLLAKELNKQLQPTICFWLPLLKRESFHSALYSLAELGVNQIQPVLVCKTQRKWGGEKEFQRSQKILAVAAEQSKHFAFPTLLEPKTLKTCCLSIDSNRQAIFFDPEGKSLLEFMPTFQSKDLVLLVGPEGDLTDQEKRLLKQHDFLFCSLTPTVLRASQAAAISTGIFRTFLRS